MAVLTLADIKAIAKTILNEKSDVFWNGTQQLNMANIAQNDCFKLIANINPDWFMRVNDYTWAANLASKPIQDVTGESHDPYRLVQVEATPNPGPVSQHNLPRRFLPMHLIERSKFMRQSDGYNFRYCYQNKDLYLAPIPTQPLYLQVYYVAEPTPFTADGDEVFGGEAPAFHEHVAYRLAYLLDAKQNGASSLAQQQWLEKEAEIRAGAVSRTTEPQFIQFDHPRAGFGGRRGR